MLFLLCVYLIICCDYNCDMWPISHFVTMWLSCDTFPYSTLVMIWLKKTKQNKKKNRKWLSYFAKSWQNGQYSWPILQAVKSSGWRDLREGWYYDLVKWLSHYLFFFFFFFFFWTYYIGRSMGKISQVLHSHSHSIGSHRIASHDITW